MATANEWTRIRELADEAGMEISRCIVHRAIMAEAAPAVVMRRGRLPDEDARKERLCRQGFDGVTSAQFDGGAWIERVVELLPPLAQAQEPFCANFRNGMRA